MRVIKKGKLPGDRLRIESCDYCGCEFEFAEKEARYVSDFRDGDALVIRCPTCKKDVWIAARA